MRQVGQLSNEADAQRFAAYLITENVDAHAEADGKGWVIWVRDENDVDKARESLNHYARNPQDPQYQGVVREAQSILREKERQQQKARENVVEMRGRWKSAGGAGVRNATLTKVMIGLCVVVGLLTGGAFNPRVAHTSATMRQLSFCDYASPAWDGDPLSDVKAGQVWRLVTPIFIHFGAIHLIFNLFMFHYFASQIEDRRGVLIFVLLVLGLAAVSNFAQAAGMAWEQRPPSFGGMSGVVYGLFGYIWMKTLFEPEAGMFVSQSTVFILIAWFFLCIAGLIGNVANIAHGAGLVMGILCGAAPVIWKSMTT